MTRSRSFVMAAGRSAIRALSSMLIVGAIALSAVSAAAAEFNPVPRASQSREATSRLLVRLRTSGTASAKTQADTARATALAKRATLALKATRQIAPSLQLLRLEAPLEGAALDDALARLRTDADVEFAAVDERRYALAVPSDPLYTNQWFLQGAQASAIDATAAWDVTQGSAGTVIAVLDTGVRFDHPDLGRAGQGGRLLPGFDFVSGESTTSFLVANDGSDWDSDPSDPGDWINATDQTQSLFEDCDASPSSWHGTRVSGVIGALTNNATGVAGITWKPWILPVRVLGKCGGYDSDIITAMRWAVGLSVPGVGTNPYPAKIINMSLGSDGIACPSQYAAVVREIVAAGGLIVASAGNSGGPVGVPANCPGVLGVAALRHVGSKVGFSNLGPEIGISSPGGNCVNTGAGQPCLFSLDTTVNAGTQGPTTSVYTDQFNANLGTSFSAPIATGVVALMHAVNGNLSPAQLVARLQEGSRPFPTSIPLTSGETQQPPSCHVPVNNADLQLEQCLCTTATCGMGMAYAPGAVRAAQRPIAAIALPASIAAGQNVALDGSGSGASCNRTISTYAWTVVNGGATPPGISGASTANASVVAPSSGTFTLRLTVTDSLGAQDTADVIVGATSATSTAPARAGTTACPTDIVVASTGGTGGGGTGGGGTTTPPTTTPNSGGGGGALGSGELALLLAGLALAIRGRRITVPRFTRY